MTDIDLGSVTVALATIPAPGQASSSPTQAPSYDRYSDESANAVRALPRPAHLPPGLNFLDATLLSSPIEMAIWTYADAASGRSLTLARSALASLKAGSAGKPVVYVPGASLHEGTVAAKVAARVVVSADPAWRGARTTLVWIKDDAVFQITGRGIDDQDLSLTAESI